MRVLVVEDAAVEARGIPFILISCNPGPGVLSKDEGFAAVTAWAEGFREPA